MKEEFNPFPVSVYMGPKYFCDREKETETLISALTNQRNVTLFSPRRYGKTGVIDHVLYKMSKKKLARCIYIDIYATRDFQEFVNLFGSAVAKEMAGPVKNFISFVSNMFSSLRPTVSFDAMSGMPQIDFNLQTDQQAKTTLEEIFKSLKAFKQPIVIAIDEFQQIANYPQDNIEAILRTEVSRIKNTNFIFCGSHQHSLLPMFIERSRPFYQSTDFLSLEKLNHEKYTKFIQRQFKNGERIIETNDVQFILDWCRVHTYYVQKICNRIYATHKKRITREIITQEMMAVLLELDSVFNNFKLMLPKIQWQLLNAMALEEEVAEPTGRKFLLKYSLPAASSIFKSIKALQEKELIYITGTQPDTDKPIYQIYDVFLGRWMQYR